MLLELLGFLLSTNAKVKKMTTVSAVIFEIFEMYIFQIHLHYFFSVLHVKGKRDLFYFEFVPEFIHCFRSGLKFWTCLHATVLLAVKYSAELNKYILLVRVICEKYRFRGQSVSRTVKCPSPLKRLGIFASPLNRYFSQKTLTNRIYLYKMLCDLVTNALSYTVSSLIYITLF